MTNNKGQAVIVYSLLFKTIEDDATSSGLRIKNAFSDAFSSDKFLSFSSDSNFLSNLNNDIENLNGYKEALSNNIDPQQAFNQNLASSSSALKEYVKNTNEADLSAAKFADSERQYQVQLAAGDRSLSNIKTLMNEYNSSLDSASGGITKCGLSQKDFIDSVNQSNSGFASYLQGLNGAEASMSGYVGNLIAAKAATVGMQVATMALNTAVSMLASAAIGLAITGIMKLADALDNSFSKAVERAADSKRAFEDSQSEVDDLTTRVEDMQAEIEKLESSSLTDPKDVENLKEQKALLEAQLEIKKQIANAEGEQAALDANNALMQERGITYKHFKDRDNVVENSNFLSGSSGPTYETIGYGNIIDETKHKQELLNEATEKYNDLLIKHSKTKIGSKDWKAEEKELNELNSYITEVKGEVTENTKDISEQVDTLQGKAGYAEAVNQAKSVYQAVEDGTEKIKTTSQIAEGMDLNLSEILGKNSDDFTTKVDDYITKTSELDDALNKLESGDLSDLDMAQLVKDFPELEGKTDDLGGAIEELQGKMKKSTMKEFSSQMENIQTAGGVAAMEKLKESILGTGEAAVDTTSMMQDLKNATELYANIQKAQTESNSATGVSYDNVMALDGLFSDLDGYDQAALFEKTATGIHLNYEELERLNDLYAQDEAKKYSDSLVQLNQELALAQEQRDKYAEYKDATSEADIAKKELYESYDSQVESLQNQIAEVQNMATAWQGVTNAYNEYVMAQSSGNERDSLAGVAKDKDTIKKTIDQGWGASDDVDAYFDLVLGEDHPKKASEAWKQLNKDIGDTGHSLADYMATNKNGELQSSAVTAWFNDISKVAGEGFAKIEEDGTKTLDLTGNKAEILAQKFGTTVEYVTLLAQALSETGVNVDFGNLISGADAAAASAEKVTMSVDQAKKELSVLQEAGKIDSSIDLDIDVSTASTDKLKSTLEGLDKVKIDAEVDPAGYAALEKLKAEVQKEYLIRINVETGGEIESAQKKIEAIKKLVGSDGIKVALKGDNGDQIKQKIDELQNMSNKAKVAIGFDVKKGDYEGALSKIKNQKISVPANIEWKAGETPKDVPDAKGTANFILGESPKDVPDAKGTANFKLGDYPKSLPTITQTVKVNRVEGPKAMGTMHFPTVAHKDGTMHNVLNWKSAYANGRVALDKDEEALVNELGTESLILLCHFM